MFKSDEIDKDWGKTWIGAEVVNSETLQIYTSLDIKLYSIHRFSHLIPQNSSPHSLRIIPKLQMHSGIFSI
jgi:hypothetical protein